MLEGGKVLQERYRIERQIGQGGMGAVYLANDSRFNSTVAIKETLIADENFRKALKREARLLNSLKHTALPKVSDHFIEDNGQYIVMEYISGEDLYALMERTGAAFPMSDVRIWTEQLLDALEYLHNQENPIIHRDIKPQNLKLTPQGQIILLDFGLAKGNPTDANHKTAANSIFGYSRHYASLEQIQGTGTDPRSDIYSLAATLYHLSTGTPPVDALTRVMHVMNEEPDPLIPANEVHEQVDEHFASALGTCMSLNANLRPQTAGEMYELLFSEQKTVATQKTKATDSLRNANISSQNTKILPADPGSGGTRPSDVRTEVMMPVISDPASDSVATRLASRDTGEGRFGFLTGGAGGRSRLLAKAGAVVLVLFTSAAAIAYYVDLVGEGDIPEVKPPVMKESVPPAEGKGISDAAADVVKSARDENVSPSGSPDAGSTAPAATTAVQKRTDHSTQADFPVPGPDKEQLEALKNLEKEFGKDFEFRVKNGKLVTEGVVFDEKGVLLKPIKPGDKPVRIPLTREELDSMTPAQRRNLRQALELRRKAEEKARRIEATTQVDQVPKVPEPPPPDQN